MPSTDRRALLKYVALTTTGLIGAGLLMKTTEPGDERPPWGPPVEGSGDWAIIDEDADRFTGEDVEGTLALTVQGPNGGSDRFYDGSGLRIVSYETTVTGIDPDWSYTLGQPRLWLRIRPEGDAEGAVYFSNTNAYGDTSDEEVSGSAEIRHAFDAGSGRGAVNPVLNYSGPADSDETGLDTTVESRVSVPIQKVWTKGVGGRIEVGSLRCEITETVTFFE
ncbi:hypothetical protein [Halorubrum lipolyticum]|uniref:Uncharacterized protein n=1 Tax=Halorubrum lipolyticum DSM 21995 TaxID=1227482 RepID=M0NTB3_9EURY|nr:hypothetical protein [Halorubrum lipolyticum]EMA61192.1 hypothetical protein C469_07982 [Halorubrum lipolyticum DSM 21995]